MNERDLENALLRIQSLRIRERELLLPRSVVEKNTRDRIDNLINDEVERMRKDLEAKIEERIKKW